MNEVVTQDDVYFGYILRVDRIAGSKKDPPSNDNTAVLLIHGILDCSITWLVLEPEIGLGIVYGTTCFVLFF